MGEGLSQVSPLRSVTRRLDVLKHQRSTVKNEGGDAQTSMDEIGLLYYSAKLEYNYFHPRCCDRICFYSELLLISQELCDWSGTMQAEHRPIHSPLENHPVSPSRPSRARLPSTEVRFRKSTSFSFSSVDSCRSVQVIAQRRRPGFLQSNHIYHEAQISLNNRC